MCTLYTLDVCACAGFQYASDLDTDGQECALIKHVITNNHRDTYKKQHVWGIYCCHIHTHMFYLITAHTRTVAVANCMCTAPR
jgi:hypothetical protein